MVFSGLKSATSVSSLLTWEYCPLGSAEEHIILTKFTVSKMTPCWALELQWWTAAIDLASSIVSNTDNTVSGCLFWKLPRFWTWAWCKLHYKQARLVLTALKALWDKHLCLLKIVSEGLDISVHFWGCFKAFLDPKAMGSYVSHISVPGTFLTLSFKRKIGIKM